jgi:hypothetical protein
MRPAKPLPACRSWGCRYSVARTRASGLCGDIVQGASSDLLGKSFSLCSAAAFKGAQLAGRMLLPRFGGVKQWS